MPAMAAAQIRCPGCGATVDDIDGPVHRYIGSAPACWAAYTQLLTLGPVHQYAVDAYAAQHPGVPGPQSRRSVGKHLMSLCRVLERGAPPESATRFLASITRDFPWLEPPASLGDVTVFDVRAGTATQLDWARSVWQAWSPYHDTVRGWLDER